MLKVSATHLHRWLIPVLSIVILFGFLLVCFPYNTGDSTMHPPLGLALWALWTQSGENAMDYSYCLLVPVIAAYIVFEKRRQLGRIPIEGSVAAIGWVLLGLLLFWVGSRTGKQYVGCIGIQVLLLGVIQWIWGRAMFRPLLFAWAILIFAWPLPFIDTTIAFPMRMIVSHLAYDTLNLIGVPCLQNGTALFSPADAAAGLPLGARFQIDIADPCSGLHSLLALLMFSACFSYTFLPRLWQQWTVFLSALPLVILGNVVRILLLVMGCLLWGSAFAIGTNNDPSWYHEGCGYAVFVVVLGLECLFGFFLIDVANRYQSPQPAKLSGNDLTTAPVSPSVDTNTVPLWRSSVLVGFALVMVVVWVISPPPSLPPEAGVLMNLPDKVTVPEMAADQFYGSDAEVSDAEHTLLPKDTEFSRKNYNDFSGHNVFFSIVLSGKQQYTIHRPQVCLVGQGWTIVKEEDVPIQLKSGHNLVVRNLSIQRESIGDNNERHLVHAYYMYWYVAEGLSTPSYLTRVWVSCWDRIFHNQDHRWAYVIAMSPITETERADGLNPAQTREMLSNFIRQIIPNVQKSEVATGQQLGGP